MKLSIVTISLNQRRYLPLAIQSVLSQSGINLEYIVVDPGSTDGSRDLILQYCDSRMQCVFEADSGPADGLNRGFAQATGDIFGFLNSDDELLPGALRHVADCFSNNPQRHVLMGEGFIVGESGQVVRRVTPSLMSPKRYLYGLTSFLQQATFFRASSFLKVNGFNAKNRTCWDGELLFDMALSGARFARTNEPLAYFRVHRDSITGSNRLAEAYYNDQMRIFSRAMGRSWTPCDTLAARALRPFKALLDPVYAGRRLAIQLGKWQGDENC